MITFYSYTPDCHKLRFGDITIYYIFKLPFAYRTKSHGLRVRSDALKGHWGMKSKKAAEEIIWGNTYVTSEPDAFKYNLEEQAKRAILEMAKQIALEGLKLC